jgi:hypothetical protein
VLKLSTGTSGVEAHLFQPRLQLLRQLLRQPGSHAAGSSSTPISSRSSRSIYAFSA